MYQAACKNQQDYDWGEGIESHVADLEGAKVALDKEVASILQATKCTKVIMALSSSPNFRYSVLPTYKHNRKDKLPPLLRADLNEYVKENYEHRQKPGLEGDDILGIFMTMSPGKYICATTDKDLKQIPGKHYNFQKELFFTVTPAEGDRYFYYQILAGDTADGYSGCPGVGKKNTEEFLDDPYLLVPYEYVFSRGQRKGETEIRYTKEPTKDIWSGIVSLYEAKGLTEADALQQARVARILRNTDYNFKDKEPILWSPSKGLNSCKS